MAYEEWVIGGLTPSCIIDVDKDYEKGIFTFSCIARRDLLGTDPQTEIDSFNEIASGVINNLRLINGGTKLQVNNGDYITLTDGNETWERSALHKVKYNSDYVSGRWILFELVVEVELEGIGGSFTYSPDYNEYNNIEYYFWTDKTERITGDNADGTEVGWMKIIEEQLVKKVEVYGSACVGSNIYPNYLDINGQKQYWKVSHDYGWAGNTLPPGWEKLEFILDTPTDELIIQSPNHVMPNDTMAINLGAWLQWIRVIYGEA